LTIGVSLNSHPPTLAFKKFCFALIKLASWDQLELQSVQKCDKNWRLLDKSDESGETFRYVKPPLSDTYFVPGGSDGEVLVHLATHLHQDYKAAVTRVVKFVQNSGKVDVTAIIISLESAIVVKVNLNNDSIRVAHTTATSFYGHDGYQLLAAIILPPECYWFRPLNSTLPADILEPIFENFCKTDGTASDLSSWRLTCKEFNGLAERKLVRLNQMNVLNFCASRKEIRESCKVFIKDEEGKCRVWRYSDFDDSGSSKSSKSSIWRVLDREIQQPIGCCALILEPLGRGKKTKSLPKDG